MTPKIQTIIQKVRNWETLSPLHSFGLINPSLPCTFLQMFALEKISDFLNDEFVFSLIPALVGFLHFATNTTCPVSEYLVELSSRCPILFGSEILWNICALDPRLQTQAVFCHLFEEIMMVNPQARKQFTLEKTVMDYLRNFVRDNKDVNFVQCV